MSTPQQGPQQPFQPYQPMSQPPQQPSGVQPPAGQRQPKRFGVFALGGAGLAGLLLGGIIVGAASGGSASTAAAPAPTVTVTASAPAVEGGSEPTEEPTEEPTDSTFSPKESEFEVSIKITDKQCFGSAGCNVTFKPKLAYGLDEGELPSEGVTSVTYEVSGTEDDFTGTLELNGDGTYTGGDEQDVSTTSSSKKLVAKVTDVSYNQYG